jgi:hypothetical protein
MPTLSKSAPPNSANNPAPLVIIDVVEQREVEYKSGQYFYRDPDIMQELAKDRYLVQNSG